MPRRPPRPKRHGSDPADAPQKHRWNLTLVDDPLTKTTAELRAIQPYKTDKVYSCPGCRQQIAPGTGHVVVVPLGSPSDRRHWHLPCWERRRERPADR
jgi:hypothetical protein